MKKTMGKAMVGCAHSDTVLCRLCHVWQKGQGKMLQFILAINVVQAPVTVVWKWERARPDCSAQVAMPFFASLAMERTKVKATAKVPIPPPPPYLGHAVCVMQLHVTVA